MLVRSFRSKLSCFSGLRGARQFSALRNVRVARAATCRAYAVPEEAASPSLCYTPVRQLSEQAAQQEPRESMEYDVLIVGAGPAGLAAAIRLRQLAAETGKDIKVCVVEKGAEVGSHIMSGNVFEPKALDELIPNWKEKGAPLDTEAANDHLYFLTKTKALRLPTPPSLHNRGNYVISLSDLCKWLATQAEELGVEIFPGFAAAEVLYGDKGEVLGVATGDMGVGKDGKPKDTFQRGMELRAKQTLFAEGTRGSLSQLVMKKYDLRKDADPQTYGLGVKEIWEIDEKKHKPGFVMHTIGWPSPTDTWSGTFLYHMKPNRVLVGMVIGLDYPNPTLSPYQEFQQFKTHPEIRKHLEGGKCISYGARTINEGGLQSIPKLTFPGGALIGCSAGFLNVPKIKGSHNAMKSGMVAAESIFDRLKKGAEIDALAGEEVKEYEDNMQKSWVYKELHEVRNVRPSFNYGFLAWLAYSGLNTFILKGKEPWTFHHKHQDWEATKPLSEITPIQYPKPDGVLSFDLLSNLARSGTNHEEDQPSHLKIKAGMEDVPLEGLKKYGGPEQYFCPAKVYEWIQEGADKWRLQINKANCVHCKTCDIKPYKEFIRWTTPEGGGGPNYSGM